MEVTSRILLRQLYVQAFQLATAEFPNTHTNTPAVLILNDLQHKGIRAFAQSHFNQILTGSDTTGNLIDVNQFIIDPYLNTVIASQFQSASSTS